MMEGNAACGLGAVYAGATVAAWYPITPSTSVVEAFTEYAEEFRVDKETGKIISPLYKPKMNWLQLEW